MTLTPLCWRGLEMSGTDEIIVAIINKNDQILLKPQLLLFLEINTQL